MTFACAWRYAALLFVPGAAGAAPTDSPTELRIRMNASVTLPDSPARVTLIEVQDGRCPRGVECLFPGSAYAVLRFELGSERRLLAVGAPSLPPGYVGNYSGYEFCYVSLYPERFKAFEVRPEKYVLRFTVSKTGSTNRNCPATRP